MTNEYWQDRVVLVTGASRGIGRATALLFSEMGATVCAHGRDENQLQRVAEAASGEIRILQGDLRDSAACERAIAEAAEVRGSVDVLVNNAGANAFHGVLDSTVSEWDDCLNLDLRAPWLCARHVASVMPRGGAIVNVGSNHARSTMPGTFPYNVAKAGLHALTQSLALDLAPRGIRANTVEPGYIDTPINDAYFATFPNPQSARSDAERLHPVARLGAAREVAHAIAYLADTYRSGFTTGTALTVDGGRGAMMQDVIFTTEPDTEEKYE